MEKISVIFAGTGDFGVPILKNLISDQRVEIPFVISGTDKRKGRGLQKGSSSIKQLAELSKLIVHTAERIGDLGQKIIQASPDILLVAAYGEIIPVRILKIPKYGSVNIHGSLLPKYRGAAPIQECLRNGDKLTGVTWIQMTAKMDAGPIIAQEIVNIKDEDDAETLSKRLSERAAEKTASVLFDWKMRQKSAPQNESAASYCKKITKDMGRLNFQIEDAEEMTNKIRAYTPWPGCFIFWNNMRLKIIQAHIGEQKISSGEVVRLSGDILAIGTKKGVLIPTLVQPESKRKMTIEEFLRGQKNIPSKV